MPTEPPVEQGSELSNLLSDMSDEQQKQLMGLLTKQRQQLTTGSQKVVEPATTTGAQAVVDETKKKPGRVRKFLAEAKGRSLTGGIPKRDLADSLLQFKFLHESGCEMMRALEILSNTTNPVVGRMFATIRKDVENGVALADAFGKHERRVGRVVVSTIRAAEESGTLANSLEFLADNINRDDEVRARIRRALAYPVMTALFTFTVFIGCLLFVVPKFKALFFDREDIAVELNFITAVVFWLSDFLKYYYYLWLPVLIFLAFAVIQFWRTQPEVVDRVLLRIPFVNRMLTLGDMARFSDRLGLLLQTGVPIIKAVNLAKETVGNRVLRPLFARMASQAELGRPLSEAFEDIKHLPHGVVDMIRVGEDASALPATLKVAARNIRTEMEREFDKFTRWVQPVGILLVSGFVVILVLALFMPYLDMISAIPSQSGEVLQNPPQ